MVVTPDRESPGRDRAKVLDFGIAKVAEEYQKQEGDHVKTQTGMVLGTPLYMSPEQCRGAESVTAKGDVYSLGVMLFQMLAGSLPFTGQSMGELIALHMFEPPPDIAKLEPTLPAELSGLVMRMLAKQPDGRPSMPEVVKELELLGADRTDLGAMRRPELGSLSSAGASAVAAADVNVATNLVSNLAAGPIVNDKAVPKLAAGATVNDKAVQTTSPPSTLGGAVGERGGKVANPTPTPALAEPRAAEEPRAVPEPKAVPASPNRALFGVGGLVAVGIAVAVALTQRQSGQPTPAAPEIAAPAAQQWSLSSDPKGAQVIRKSDGKVLGVTPLTFTPERAPSELVLILRREGFFDKELKLDPAQGGSRNEILVPIADNQVKILE